MKKQVRKSAPPVKSSAKRASVTSVTEKENLFTKAEAYLEKHQTRWLLVFPLILGALFALLLFDVKISEGNDDAMYIEAATKYAKDFTGYFYTANAPLYPMFLGVVTMISGFNLILYKLINTFFFLAHLVIMFFALRKRVPNIILFPILILLAVNSYFLYYASQTYTEMLFVFLQGLFFWIFFSWNENHDSRLKNNQLTNKSIKSIPWDSLNFRFKGLLSIGFTLLLLMLCKNIAVGALGAMILFYLIEHKWQRIGEVVIGFLIVKFLFEGLKYLVWGNFNQYGAQGAILLQKDPYNPSAGKEDINGFIDRFFGNFNLYISKRTFQVLGFEDPNSIEVHTVLSIIISLLLIFSAIRIWKEILSSRPLKKPVVIENKQQFFARNMLFILIYVICMLFLTFIVLQLKWDQTRLVFIYVPLIIMVILYGCYSQLRSGKGYRIVEFTSYIMIVTIIIGSSFLTTVKKAVINYPILKKNLKGDLYFGYTADWENFLRLSAWCADSLPPNSYVASRKAPMSFVYGHGKPFFPVYTVTAVDSTTHLSNPDSVLALFHKNKVTHVILGSLRRNPEKPDGYVINTLHRMLEPVAMKYPDKVILVKQIGTVEPAYLYEIKY